jgi:hypothetical protein
MIARKIFYTSIDPLHSFKVKRINTERQWLTPVILPTWEAKIRRIVVEGQSEKNSL